jgi:hypothetical protein
VISFLHRRTVSMLVAALLGASALVSCSDPWDTTTTYSGAQFDAKVLEGVSQATGLRFPVGSQGLECHYSSWIDSFMHVKVVIPESGRAEFLENPLFKNGNVPEIVNHPNLKWWKADKLTDAITMSIETAPPNREATQCSFGRENGQWVAYISWLRG